ncbi:hypothetical protein GCM10009661_12870 [Catellatospora chokoriensis]|uniref:Uncharacterized protein n=1 Tax=Catellatospora chokoriensis TaxID=310353 RepID=A0A8J3JPT1_9ACTN|nr:hypothetical protein Cch02nite_22910 [Catellatospora chokoriensis]
MSIRTSVGAAGAGLPAEALDPVGSVVGPPAPGTQPASASTIAAGTAGRHHFLIALIAFSLSLSSSRAGAGCRDQYGVWSMAGNMAAR